MKTHRLLLPMFMGALAVLATLAALGQSRAVADVPHEWSGHWYWKDGGWTDYAPSGVPDFDQKQDCWGAGGCPVPGIPPARWTYCGPVAAANSLWWFDSKFERTPIAPSIMNDSNYLVTTYNAGGWDDHAPANVGGLTSPGLTGPPGLVDDLSWYFDTDGRRTGPGLQQGTKVRSMFYGLQWYLYGGNPAWGVSPYGPRYGSHYDDYHVQLVKKPTFEWVEEEVERSEDVILLLGFWQWQDPDGAPGSGDERWARLGGHYVTVAGINSADLQIAFSDPFFDNAETGGPGRVLSGTLIAHQPQPGHAAFFHSDAGNVSHDSYAVTQDAISPAGVWEVLGYPYSPNFSEQNVPQEFEGDYGAYDPGAAVPVAEVEYAIAMSPFYWKPGGEWVWTWWNGAWMWEWWGYEDDGDSCLSDFWWGLDATWQGYDGPVALANSLWWFDSKAETLKTGGFPESPPVVSDHYNLVGAYGAWDDHAISNTLPFISDLAQHYLNTTSGGTTREDLAAGIGTYLAARGVASDFYIKSQESPSFEWVVNEVETCEDVILLLGFYERMSAGTYDWERKGAHWVNAAGVSQESNLIGLSDPTLDHAVGPSISDTLYLGRVFPPEHLGTSFTSEEKKDPQSISHDIYAVVTGTLPNSHQWALADYPATSVITDFVGLNGGESAPWTGRAISTTVEWAIAVSPYSDLVITKTAVLTEVVPGDRVTYTLEYANTGLAAVDYVTVTDILPLGYLTNVRYVAWPPISSTQGVTYVWTLPRLSYGQRGLITITAESLATMIPANTASITGLNAIGGPTPDKNPNNNAATMCVPMGSASFQYAPADPQVGQTIVFTATATGSSPITTTWSADDGWSASGPTRSHAFTNRGWHTVWLTATNPCGQKSTSRTIFVHEHGVTIAPHTATGNVDPGQTVTYTLRVTNTGNVADVIGLGHTGPSTWTVTYSANPLSLGAGGGVDVKVYAGIPASASRGSTGIITVTATSQADPTKRDAGVLTTHVGQRFVYLPIVLRNHQ